MTHGILATADGAVFRGRAVGAAGIATGEVVFNTAMTGYQEVVTDPSYRGQIVVMTAPHVGNYGVNREDGQSDGIQCAGFVVRSMARRFSNHRAGGSLDDALRAGGVVALDEVDTRRLTRHVRTHGAMPAAIGIDGDEADLVAVAEEAPSLEGRDLVAEVATTHEYRVEPEGPPVGHVVAIDLGMKRDIMHQLTRRGLAVTVVPPHSSAQRIQELRPDGVFLSNGPGDPEPLHTATATVRSLLGTVPVYGICLGHQILGRAIGATTYKLPFGHHGGNHPVRRLSDGVVEITSQNHGFAVDLWSLSAASPGRGRGLADPSLLPDPIDTPYGPVVATHQNLNDGTLEGLALPDANAASVQYHPEAAPGPNEAKARFDEFVAMLERA